MSFVGVGQILCVSFFPFWYFGWDVIALINEEADKQIAETLKKNVVQLSASLWASGIVMVKRKDGSKRFCLDYRRLNDITTKDA